MNSNQKCLIAVSLLLVFLACLLTIPLILNSGDLSVLQGTVPLALIGSIPALIVWRQQRKKRKSKRSKRLFVISQAPPSDRYLPVTISTGESLPGFCSTCGSPTKRTTRLTFENNESSPSKYSLAHVNPALALFIMFKLTAIAIGTSIAVFFERLWSKHSGKRNALIFQIPHCKSCSKRYPIHRHHLDFHGGTMIIHARDKLAMEIQRREDAR